MRASNCQWIRPQRYRAARNASRGGGPATTSAGDDRCASLARARFRYSPASIWSRSPLPREPRQQHVRPSRLPVAVPFRPARVLREVPIRWRLTAHFTQRGGRGKAYVAPVEEWEDRAHLRIGDARFVTFGARAIGVETRKSGPAKTIVKATLVWARNGAVPLRPNVIFSGTTTADCNPISDRVCDVSVRVEKLLYGKYPPEGTVFRGRGRSRW